QIPSPTSLPNLLTGSGRSPADVSLSAWFDANNNGGIDDSIAPKVEYVLFDGTQHLDGRSEYQRLLRGAVLSSGGRVEGRYGEGVLLTTNPAAPIDPNAFPMAGVWNADDNMPGYAARDSVLALGPTPRGSIGLTNIDLAPTDPGRPVGLNGSPTDADGNGGFGVSITGSPRYFHMDWSNGVIAGFPIYDHTVEDEELNPYHVSHYSAAGVVTTVDNPFGWEELEALLRRFDVDSTKLTSRIRQLAPKFFSNLYLSSLATTHSSDVPSPSYIPPQDIAKATAIARANASPPLPPLTNYNIIELVRGRILARDVLAGQLGLTPGAVGTVDARLNLLLNPNIEAIAPELILGLRLDVNRPFGNNHDDNSNGIVDESQEIGNEPLFGGLASADRNGNGVISVADDFNVRARFAKHLFMLMMVLKDSGYLMASEETELADPAPVAGTPIPRYEWTVRRLAQWCVNVVDFRDQDAIMTGFEYDVDPFNDDGWGVDGDLTTINSPDRRVVWGCEKPSLLLTETMAGHDLRVNDLAAPAQLRADGD
ncbi:MAG: hypothetical protein N2C14_11505, partial [Planctomycetales bacterium]